MSRAQLSNLRIPQRMERLPLTNYQRIIFLAIATCWLFDGIDFASMTYMLGPVKNTFNLTTAEAGFVSSASFFGMVFGASLAGLLADRYGRRKIFQVSMIIWGVSSFLCSQAQTPEQLFVFRFCLGFGMGSEWPIGQALVSEFMPAKNRGRYIAMLEGLWPIAFILAGLICYFLLPVIGWRGLYIAEAIPAFFLIFFRLVVPESPRWLASVGRLDEAEKVMSLIENKVGKSFGKELPAVPESQFSEQRTDNKFSFFQLWSPLYAKRTIMVWLMWFGINLGYYGLTNWLSVFLQNAGYSITKSVLYTVTISTSGVPGFLTAAYLVEKVGRKKTLIFELLGGCLFCYLYGTAGSLQTMIAFGLCMQFCLFGMWSALYAYTPELYPTAARVTGTGFASAVGRLGSILGISVVGIILPYVGIPGVFILGGGCFILVALIIWLLGEETKGRVLEEVSP